MCGSLCVMPRTEGVNKGMGYDVLTRFQVSGGDDSLGHCHSLNVRWLPKDRVALHTLGWPLVWTHRSVCFADYSGADCAWTRGAADCACSG